MQTALAAFSSAVTGASQQIAYSVVITLPARTVPASAVIPTSYGDLSNNLVSMQGFYRQITTSTPDTTTLISGYPSSQPELVFAGPLNLGDGVVPDFTKTVYWLFNPYDPTSPLYRQAHTGMQIVIQIGLYDGSSVPDLVTVFTGTIDSVECDIDGSVTMSCLDRSNTITDQATLPPVITSAPYNAGLTNEFAIDYLFRHASPAQYYSWPALRPNCVLAVGFRSSIWPDVGSYAAYVQEPTFVPGINGTALYEPTNGVVYTLTAPITPAQPVNIYYTAVANLGSAPIAWVADISGNYNVYLIAGSTTLTVQVTTPGGTVSEIITGVDNTVPHQFAVHFTWAASSTLISGTIYSDNATFGLSMNALDARTFGNFVTGVVGGGPIEGLQITSESAVSNVSGFVPTLLFDPNGSLNSLTALPDISGQTTGAVLQDIAVSEAAVIGFNELGQAFFTNRETIQNATVDRTVTSTTSLMSLATLEQQSLVATHIQIPVNQIQIQPPSIVWQGSTPLQVNPGTPLVFTATTQDPVVNVPIQDSGYFNSASWSQLDAYWMACTTPDGTGAAITSGISFTIDQISPTQLEVTVSNTSGQVAYLVSTLINPGIGFCFPIIGGQFITAAGASVANGSDIVPAVTGAVIADAQWPPVTSGGAIANITYGEVLLAISANAWVQDLPTAQLLALYYLEDLSSPKPIVQNINIIPDARIQNLDRLTIIDTDISGINADILLIGINISIANGAYSQTIDGRLWTRPGAWILGVQGSSELASTTWIY